MCCRDVDFTVHVVEKMEVVVVVVVVLVVVMGAGLVGVIVESCLIRGEAQEAEAVWARAERR